MFPQRKLAQELAQSIAAAVEVASASSSVPEPGGKALLRPQAKRKLDHPTESFGDAEEADLPESIRCRAEAAKHLELDVVVVVTATTECMDKTLATGDPDLAGGLDDLQGCYFNTQIELNGAAIFKSTTTRSDGHDMYMFKSRDGWYVADQVFISEKDKNKLAKAGSDVKVLVWAQGDVIPRKVHYPFWSAKADPGIKVTPLWEFSLEQANEKAELAETVAALKAELEAATSVQPAVDATAVEMQDEEDADVGTGNEDKGKSKGKEYNEKRRGGWMPKMASLASAVYNKDWGYARRLADRFCSESETLNRLVTYKLSRDAHDEWA